MKLRQLKYVVAIADHGLNITSASYGLCTSQPGVSKQLKLLEDELGVEIFVRKGKSLTHVTPAGREIIASARVILHEAGQIRDMCRRLNEDEPVRRQRGEIA